MADKQKKDNFFKRIAKAIVSYVKATKSELKKVSWPSMKQIVNNTGIVIVCIVIVGLVIFALDTLFTKGFEFLTNKKAETEEATEQQLTQEEINKLMEEYEAQMATAENGEIGSDDVVFEDSTDISVEGATDAVIE